MLNHWVGKIPWSRKWQPTLVSLPGKFHGQRSLVDYTVHGVSESWTQLSTPHTHTHTHTHRVLEAPLLKRLSFLCFEALYSVSLVYISVFLPVPQCFHYCSFILFFSLWLRFSSSSCLIIMVRTPSQCWAEMARWTSLSCYLPFTSEYSVSYGVFIEVIYHIAAAAAKSLQSCPALCDPIDGSPPGSPVPGILQVRTLEWVAISFSNAWKWQVKVKLLSRVHGLQPTRLLRHGIFQARVLEWGAIAFSIYHIEGVLFLVCWVFCPFLCVCVKKRCCILSNDLGFFQLCSLWDLSSLTRDWTHAPCSGSTEP